MLRGVYKLPNLSSKRSATTHPTLMGGIDRKLIRKGILEKCYVTKQFDGRLLSDRSVLILIKMWEDESVKYTSNQKLFKCPIKGDIVSQGRIYHRLHTLEVNCPRCGDPYTVRKENKIKRNDLLCNKCYDYFKDHKEDSSILQKMFTQQKLIYRKIKEDIITEAKIRRKINNSDL